MFDILYHIMQAVFVYFICICVIVYLYSLATDWPGSGYLLTVSVASVKQIVIIIIKCPFGCRHQRLPYLYLGVLHAITRHKYANTQVQRRSIWPIDAVQHFQNPSSTVHFQNPSSTVSKTSFNAQLVGLENVSMMTMTILL